MFACSPTGSSTIMFRYYLLRGNTVTPSGLYARLCRAFQVVYRFILLLIRVVKLTSTDML